MGVLITPVFAAISLRSCLQDVFGGGVKVGPEGRPEGLTLRPLAYTSTIGR